jgi:Tfp pilus assembly protein PilX
MIRAKERGVALILTMILVAVLSVMTVSLMFLSQSETWSTMNYRLMSQSRDAAEAGLNVTANILMGNPQPSGFTYTPPALASATDPLVVYDTTVSPVTAGGAAVGLVATGSDAPAGLAYPVSTVQDDFDAASYSYLTAGNTQVNYTSYAELLSMREITAYGSTTPTTIQTWRITSEGSVAGVQNATVEVSAVLDRPIAPVFSYAAYGEGPNCGTLNWNGTNSTTGSYDSSTASGGSVTTQDWGGNVGTNGNLTEGGGATLYGSLSTPRSGVGNCSAGNITAQDINGGATVTGGLVELPQAIDYPDPAAPTPTPPTTSNNLTNNASCLALVGCVPVIAGAEYRLTPTCNSGTPTCPGGTTYGNISVGANKVLHLTAGTYSINSISLGGNAQVVIDSGPVIFNLAGQGIGANQYVADFGGGSIMNNTLDPQNFQILYAGTSDIRLTGGSQNSGLVYAPNADIVFSGGGAWYGAVIGETVTNTGGADLYYDRRLARTLYTISPYMLQAFTWKKF